MRDSAFSEAERWQDDRSLWNAFQKGDRLAFEFIYQSHIQHLISYGYKISGDKHIIQDCIQDLFMELWDSRENLAEVISVKYYLFKSLRYKIVRYLKQHHTEDLELVEYRMDDDHFERRLFEEETGIRQSQKLHAALARLPKRQKEAIHLRYFEEMTNEEVADLMGVNYQSACKFIYTALKSLRDIMLVLYLLPHLFHFLPK